MSRRIQYLQALGIDLWTLRGGVRRDQAAVRASAAATISLPAAVPPAAAEPVSVMQETEGGLAPSAVGEASWEQLQVAVSGCRLCALSQMRTQTVFGVGNLRARLLVIGEAPGAEEDRQGEPFVGRAGQLLNAMLHALGQPRDTVYIANVVKCRPPGNRDPSPAEVACCLPYLHRQIGLIGPQLILVVGRIAAQNILATDLSIGRLRGKVHRFGAGTPLVVTYHPAYLLRSPAEKRRAWADLKLARELLALAGEGQRTPGTPGLALGVPSARGLPLAGG